MAEVKYEDYKALALSQIVTIDNSLNPAAIGLTDAEARKKKLWNNKAKLPSEDKIKKQFDKIKDNLQKKVDRAERKEKEAKESSESVGEFDDLFDELYEQDEDLGLNDKQLSKLGILLNLNKKKKALNLLKKSKLLKENK